MAVNKASRPDNWPIEVIKLLKDIRTKWITSCFRKIKSEGIPQDWRKSKITPIYKQMGGHLDCRNYWGIELLKHSLKLWKRVIEARLRKIVKIKDNIFFKFKFHLKFQWHDRLLNEYDFSCFFSKNKLFCRLGFLCFVGMHLCTSSILNV